MTCHAYDAVIQHECGDDVTSFVHHYDDVEEAAARHHHQHPEPPLHFLLHLNKNRVVKFCIITIIENS